MREVCAAEPDADRDGILGCCFTDRRHHGYHLAGETGEREQQQTALKAAESQAVVDFLVNDMIASVSPEEAGRDVTVLETLRKAEAKIDDAFDDQPLVEASIRQTLATTYRALGQYKDAERHVRRAFDLSMSHLGPKHPQTLSAMGSLGISLSINGDYPRARRLLEECLVLSRRVRGTEHPDSQLVLNSLANVLAGMGQLDEARLLYEEGLELGRRTLARSIPKRWAR